MALLFTAACAQAQPCEPGWDPVQDKATANGAVRALHPSEGGDEAYAAGAFTDIANQSASFVAHFDGASWNAMGVGFDDAAFAVTQFQGAIIAAGKFTSSGAAVVNRIARWNFTEWEPLGAGLGGDAFALLSFDDGDGEALFVAGAFQTAGGAPASGIARWNGASWSSLDTGLQGGAKTGAALAVHDDGAGAALYVGGSFLGAGGQPSSNIVRWDGAAWSAVGAGLNGLVRTFALHDGDLIAAGDFTMSGATATSHLARWDGAAWTEFAGGANGPVHTLAVIQTGQGPRVIAGGEFTQIGAISADRIAVFDGSSWEALADGSTSIVRAIAPVGGAIYVGANATTPGGSGAPPLRKWNVCDAGIPGDLNGDGVVDGIDLASLLSQWGQTGSANLNDDDVVNGADLATLLSNWG